MLEYCPETTPIMAQRLEWMTSAPMAWVDIEFDSRDELAEELPTTPGSGFQSVGA
jgi:hypothetical protein